MGGGGGVGIDVTRPRHFQVATGRLPPPEAGCHSSGGGNKWKKLPLPKGRLSDLQWLTLGGGTWEVGVGHIRATSGTCF